MRSAVAYAWEYDEQDDDEQNLDELEEDEAFAAPAEVLAYRQRASLVLNEVPGRARLTVPEERYWTSPNPSYNAHSLQQTTVHDYYNPYNVYNQPPVRGQSLPDLSFLLVLVNRKLIFAVLTITLGWFVVSNLGGWFVARSASNEAEIFIPSSISTTINPNQLKQAAPVAAGTTNILGVPTISPEKIDAVLRSYRSPAAGIGQSLYDLGLKYGIDPAYALAFFVQESSAGTAGVATVTKSIGNIRVTPGYENYQGFRKYASWEAGAEDWYKLIKDLYVKQWKLTTVETIIPVYAPAADRNNPSAYINHVNNLVTGWRAGR